MHSPALAIAWELQQRHRWGFLGVLAFFAVLAAVPHKSAVIVLVPVATIALYFLAIFSFGFGGDFAARQSMYPPRMFTLPVTTSALAGWPMLYGTLAMAALWLVTRLLGAWPADVDVPVLWPALLGPAVLAWTQALTWMPYPLRGLRVIVTMLWLTVIDAVVLTALELKVPEWMMIAILAPQVPMAWVVARMAVKRARHGNLWRTGNPACPDEEADRQDCLSSTRPFPSAAHAQTWLEWRQHGRSLPALVAILLPFELAMFFLFPDTPQIVFEMLVLIALSPPLLAVFVAAAVSGGVTPFLATRPMADAALIAAKLRVTIASTLIAWLLVLIAVPVALKLSGAWTLVAEFARGVAAVVGLPRAIALALLALFALIASTWKQLVQSLCIGMSGREWLIKGSVFAALVVMAIGLPLVDWIFTDRAAMAALWNASAWILAALVCVKVSLGAWIAMRLHDRRLLGERALVKAATAWSLGALALYGALAWIIPPMMIRTSTLGLVAILVIPLARLAAAPLALDWNRHR